MAGQDVAVWVDYQAANADGWDWVEYDVRCGTVQECPPSLERAMRRMVESLSAKRVDAVVGVGEVVQVVEVKERGGMSALGQVLTYRECLLEEGRFGARLEAVIVCRRADVDVGRAAPLFGVRVVEVPPQG